MIRKCLAASLCLAFVAMFAQPGVAPAQEAAPQGVAVSPEQAEKDLVLDTLHQRLSSFAHDWLSRLRRNQLAGPSTAEVMSAPDGTYVARYFQVTEDADPVCLVRESTMKPGAYIGSIVYKVAVYECIGSSASEAKRGPYQHTSFTTLNEIFSIGSKDSPWSAPK